MSEDVDKSYTANLCRSCWDRQWDMDDQSKSTGNRRNNLSSKRAKGSLQFIWACGARSKRSKKDRQLQGGRRRGSVKMQQRRKSPARETAGTSG